MRLLFVVLLAATCFAQEILRPTTDVDGGALALGCAAGINVPSPAMPLGYDQTGISTYSFMEGLGTFNLSRYVTRLFRVWQGTGNQYTALTLNVNASATGNIGDSPATSCLKYSIDGGASYTTIKCETGGGYLQQTFTVTLSPTQNLSKLRIGICAQGNKGIIKSGTNPGQDQVAIYDIWTVGINPSPASGNGSTAGQAHRGVVVTN